MSSAKSEKIHEDEKIIAREVEEERLDEDEEETILQVIGRYDLSNTMSSAKSESMNDDKKIKAREVEEERLEEAGKECIKDRFRLLDSSTPMGSAKRTSILSYKKVKPGVVGEDETEADEEDILQVLEDARNKKIAMETRSSTGDDVAQGTAPPLEPPLAPLQRQRNVSMRQSRPGAYSVHPAHGSAGGNISSRRLTEQTSDVAASLDELERGGGTGGNEDDVCANANSASLAPRTACTNGDDSADPSLPLSSGSPVDEALVSAHLVNDMEDQEVVEAQPALTGFKALLHIKRFKYIFLPLMILVIVASVITVTVVVTTTRRTTNPIVETAHHNMTTFVDCGTRSSNQRDYRGFVGHTADGTVCQLWDLQTVTANQDSLLKDLYPDAGLDGNFCRNPDNDTRAWCFPADSNTNSTRKVYCNVPFCDDLEEQQQRCGTLSLRMQDYRGTINVTASGKTCQRWSDILGESAEDEGLEENYCRSVKGNESLTWCYTALSNNTDLDASDTLPWEYCDVPVCEWLQMTDRLEQVFGPVCENCTNLECGRASLEQRDYRGTINVTVSGLTCRDWDPEIIEKYPGDGLEKNYCRSFSGGWGTVTKPLHRPWCFTTDPDVDWEYCPVPACEEKLQATCGTRSIKQQDYRGTLSKTRSGKTCQRWDQQEPQVHTNTPDLFPFAGLDANYCRNPDGDPNVWCYTTDPNVRFEECDVEFCPEEEASVNPTAFCGTSETAQADYRGPLAHTISGRACQRWDLDTPHNHENHPENRANAGLDDYNVNSCRNPDNSKRAWCYTTDPLVRFEYCDVPYCDDLLHEVYNETCGSASKQQSDYRGSLSRTVSGRICQDWAEQYPHEHFYTNESFAFSGLSQNFCRNPSPGEVPSAWCFTTDPEVRFEACAVPVCDPVDNTPK